MANANSIGSCSFIVFLRFVKRLAKSARHRFVSGHSVKNWFSAEYLIFAVFTVAGLVFIFGPRSFHAPTKHAHLFIDSRSSGQMALAGRAELNFKNSPAVLNVTDCSTPLGMLSLKNLLGNGASLSTPQLLVSSGETVNSKWGGSRLYSDPQQIESELASLASSFRGAIPSQLFVLGLLAVFALAALNVDSIEKIGSVLPLLGIGAAALLPGICVTCVTGISRLEALALPIFALGCLLLVVSVYYLNPSRKLYLWMAGFFAIVPFGQLFLELQDPKFCPACFLVGTLGIMIFCTLCKWIRSGSIAYLRMPAKSRLAVTCVVVVLIAKVVASPYVNNDPPRAVVLPNYVRMPVSSIIKGPVLSRLGGIIVVAQLGCGYCRATVSALDRSRIAYHEVAPCNLLHQRDCYMAPHNGFALPVVVVYDETGNIIFAQDGWSEDLVSKLRSQLKTLNKRK